MLVGDSAHAIHPVAGQGFNLGVRDVAALARRLSTAIVSASISAASDTLENYARWRRFDNLPARRFTDLVHRLFSNDVPPVRLARDLGLRPSTLTTLHRFSMRHAMGMVGDLPKLIRGERP